MPKRSSTASTASKSPAANRSNKRVKVEEGVTEPPPSASGNVLENDAENDVGNYVERDVRNGAQNNAEVGAGDDTAGLIRDPEYYFEDGSVTFRVDGVLFKVHTSLLKAHSKDFLNKLPSSSPDSSTPSRGTCDHGAIVIPDIQSSQFRNLLKIIYCLPSNSVVFTQDSPTTNQVVGNFDCYLDVAIISRKFDMDAMHQWAKKRLGRLVHNSGKILVDEIDGFYQADLTGTSDDDSSGNDDSGNDDSELGEETVVLKPASSYWAYRFVEAIQYARAVSDNALLYDMLSIMEYYSSFPEIEIEFLISFFRIPDLRRTDPSLFGFLFLLLLSRGNQVWVEKVFTQEDRIALFSAQSFLTPLPGSLKESILAPLFTRPVGADSFTAVFPAGTGCKSGCQQEIFDHWDKTFPPSYYQSIADKEFSVPIKALTALPLRRINLSIRLRRVECQQCCQRILEQLDQDMQKVFTRLAGYYKVYG